MTLHKHFPPHLSQLVFLNTKRDNIEKINSIDYDLLIWLIYNTHKKYKDDKSLCYEFEYRDIKSTFNKKMNTKRIRESLEKISGLQIISNYLQSYKDKKIILNQPFEIEIISTDKDISYGFIVKTTDKFMKLFNNPTPKVDVNYNIIYNLKPIMSKLLYLFLRDAYGGYKNIERYRNIDINKLRNMMNVSNEKTTNSNFLTELNKSVYTINKYSDLTVKYNVKKKRNLRSGISEIVEVRFTIEWDVNKPFDIRLKERKEKGKSKNTEVDISEEITTDIMKKYSFEDYLENLVEDEYQIQLSNGIDIKNIKSYKNGIRKNLIEGGVEVEFQFVCMIEVEKDKLRETIVDNQPYRLVYKDDTNLNENYYINNECLWVRGIDNSTVTKSIEESIEFLNDNRMNLYFDILRCNESVENVGRI